MGSSTSLWDLALIPAGADGTDGLEVALQALAHGCVLGRMEAWHVLCRSRSGRGGIALKTNHFCWFFCISDGHAKWMSLGRGAPRTDRVRIRLSSSGPVIDGKRPSRRHPSDILCLKGVLRHQI